MKFNIAYCGPEHLFHLRRDLILLLKYSLEDLGHDVILSGKSVDRSRFNLIIGMYFLGSGLIESIAKSNLQYANLNTEIISNDMLNHNPKKVDFIGAYLPAMKAGRFAWDIVPDNMPEYARYNVNAHFMRWGWHGRMHDIEHRKEKDLDFYFFGMMSDRRQSIVRSLSAAGLRGAADHSCPYFLRNENIARAKIQLNLIQDDKYTHVNAFRICYLANNQCCIFSEAEIDPVNYLEYAEVVNLENIVDRVRAAAASEFWKARGEQSLAAIRRTPMKAVLEELLDRSFATTAM